MIKKTFILVFFFVASFCWSQQMVYKPINPAFGGDTFNYQWLLNSANSQNGFEDPDAENSSRTRDSELERFSENLNRQLLSQLSRTLFDTQLGNGLEEGSFTFGSLALDIYDSAEGLVVNILDTSNGEETQIIIPN